MRTMPDLALDSPAHLQARTSESKDYLWDWNRNVIDEFKSLSNEEIKRRLESTAFPYAVLFENVVHDMNVSSGIRNANAFNAREVFYLGEKKWDRRGACGCHNYMNVQWIHSLDDFVDLKKRYTIIAVDNCEGSVPISKFEYPDNSLFVFGSEGVGITPTLKRMADHLIQIPQFGSVRSLNVATASGIVMNDFVTKYLAKQ